MFPRSGLCFMQICYLVQFQVSGDAKVLCLWKFCESSAHWKPRTTTTISIIKISHLKPFMMQNFIESFLWNMRSYKAPISVLVRRDQSDCAMSEVWADIGCRGKRINYSTRNRLTHFPSTQTQRM